MDTSWGNSNPTFIVFNLFWYSNQHNTTSIFIISLIIIIMQILRHKQAVYRPRLMVKHNTHLKLPLQSEKTHSPYRKISLHEANGNCSDCYKRRCSRVIEKFSA